jgi:hypothetical protein
MLRGRSLDSFFRIPHAGDFCTAAWRGVPENDMSG